MRQLGHAGTTPGRPEINQYDLSLEIGGVNLATGSVAGDLERFKRTPHHSQWRELHPHSRNQAIFSRSEHL